VVSQPKPKPQARHAAAAGVASASKATSAPVATSCSHQNSDGANDSACAAPASIASANAIQPLTNGAGGPRR